MGTRTKKRSAILVGPTCEEPQELKRVLATRVAKPSVASGSSLGIAVDGGLDVWLRAGQVPELAVGDWDSTTTSARYRKELAKNPGFTQITLPRAKDRSDLYYALAAAHSGGVSELIALGVTGGRPDHHLASLFELGQAARSIPSVGALGPEGEYRFFAEACGRQATVSLRRGRVFSLFALGGPVTGLHLSGALYPLRDSQLSAGSRGLSNQARGPVKLRFKKGILLLVIPSPMR